MGYIIPYDYERIIQDISVQQIISGNIALKTTAELASLTEIKSYLVQKYDVAQEFTDTSIYNPGSTYKAANRVYLSAANYNETILYPLNSLTLKAGKVYRCTTAITVTEDFTIGKWELLGALNDIFYAVYPKPLFDLLGTYKKDDQVFWKDKVYTCKIPTVTIDHETAIQYNSTNNIPFGNVFPDDPSTGLAYWGSGTPYTVAAGKILDTTFFVLGDNRNQQLVGYVLDCVIYNLYSRIPPQVVPELRIYRYNAVKNWLNNVAKGNEIIADIPKLQPHTGSRIRWGSRPKTENYY